MGYGSTVRRSLLVTLGILMTACSGQGATRSSSPAPIPCPVGIVRADEAPLSRVAAVLEGHVPADLPDGFGLAHLWMGPAGLSGSALWTDDRCREIKVGLTFEGAGPVDGVALGPWTVASSAPDACGNAVLGVGRCLAYDAAIDGRQIVVRTMGMERDEADRVVLSIPT